MNIGNYARAQILLGKTNQEILEAIQKQFPAAKTTPACVAWYKSDMRKHGLIEKKAAINKKLTVEEQKAALLAQLSALEGSKQAEPEGSDPSEMAPEQLEG